MKTKLIIAATGFVGFCAGIAAGWLIRKKTEVRFVETTEEDLQAYADLYEKKEEPEEQAEETPQETEKEETGINPALDTRKADYANAWKRDEIKQREGYGEPTPGEPEDLSVTEADLDPDFEEAIREENEPRFVHITGKEFYGKCGKGKSEEVYFWYDRDDVVTRQIDDDIEQVMEDDELRKLGFDIKEEFRNPLNIEEEIAGEGLMLYMEDRQTDSLIEVVRYPMYYRKKARQEEYGGTEDLIERLHRRNGSVL